MNMNPDIKLYPSVRPKGLDDSLAKRTGKNRITFAEEKSTSLMDHTLKLFKAIFSLVKEKKERFENFDYEPSDTQELVESCLTPHFTLQDVANKLSEKGLRVKRTSSEIRASVDEILEGEVATVERVNQALDLFKNDASIIDNIIDVAKIELGPKPGYKVFMTWLYEFMDIIDGQALTKAQWFEEKNQAIDDLAYDYARYGLSPHVELKDLSPAFRSRFEASYRAAKAQYGSATKGHTPYIRKWISLRKSALTRGRSFDSNITAETMSLLMLNPHCPVTGYELEISPTDVSSDTDDFRWSVERHSNDLGYSEANICLTSNKVNRIRANLTCYEIFERAAGEVEDTRLSQIEWARLGYLHLEICKRVEPYFQDIEMPLLWQRNLLGVGTNSSICHAMLSHVVGHPSFKNGFPMSLSAFKDQVNQIRWFDHLSRERLDMEIKRLFYVYRQQLKNKKPAEVNFALMYDIKDGQYDVERAYFANQLVYLLGTCLLGGDIASGQEILDSVGKESLGNTLQTGYFKDKGFYKGH